MSVYQVEENVVTQVWRDVDDLAAFAKKYPTFDLDYMKEGEAVAGQILKGEVLENPDKSVDNKREEALMPAIEFAIIAAGKGWITDDEALAWGSKTSIPALAETIISYMPEEEQLRMRLLVLSQDFIGRNNLLMPQLMKARNVTEAEMDAVFGIA